MGNKFESLWDLMCISIVLCHHSIISLNTLTQATPSAVKHPWTQSPVLSQDGFYEGNLCQDTWGLGLWQLLEPFMLYPHPAVSAGMCSRSHVLRRNQSGRAGAGCFDVPCAVGEDRIMATRSTRSMSCPRSSPEHGTAHGTSLQNHVRKAWKTFLFPNVNYWVILLMWDRQCSPPGELLWITVITR